MDKNNNLQISVEKLSHNVLDRVSSSVKQGLSAVTNLIGGTQEAVYNTLDVADSAINDVAIPVVKRTTDIGVSGTKNIVRAGFSIVKDLGVAAKDGAGEVIENVKTIMPKGNGNITAAPAKSVKNLTVAEQRVILADETRKAEELLKECEAAKARLDGNN